MNLATEKAAICNAAPGRFNEIEAIQILKLHFPFPGKSEGPEGCGWPAFPCLLNSSSAFKEQALQILDYTSTPEGQKALIKDNFGSSFLKGVEVDMPAEYTDMAECFKANNVYGPWMYWFGGDAIAMEFGKSVQEILVGRKTVAEALSAVDKKADELRQLKN